MDLDGALKLNDALIKTEQAKVGMAGSMIDIAAKAMRIKLDEQAVIKAHLENVAKFLDIRWDAQAHKSLLHAKSTALRKAIEVAREAGQVKDKLRSISTLLLGGSWSQVRNGWVAFKFLQNRLGPLAAIKLMSFEVEPEAYHVKSWVSTLGKDIDPCPATDPAQLLEWARKSTVYPKANTGAGRLIIKYLEIINEAAVAQATELEKDALQAQESALALQKVDWERLK